MRGDRSGWYTLPIPRPRCGAPACEKPAREAVFNRYNAKVGDYCVAHARRKIAEVEREHARLWEARVEEPKR